MIRGATKKTEWFDQECQAASQSKYKAYRKIIDMHRSDGIEDTIQCNYNVILLTITWASAQGVGRKGVRHSFPSQIFYDGGQCFNVFFKISL